MCAEGRCSFVGITLPRNRNRDFLIYIACKHKSVNGDKKRTKESEIFSLLKCRFLKFMGEEFAWSELAELG